MVIVVAIVPLAPLLTICDTAAGTLLRPTCWNCSEDVSRPRPANGTPTATARWRIASCVAPAGIRRALTPRRPGGGGSPVRARRRECGARRTQGPDALEGMANTSAGVDEADAEA